MKAATKRADEVCDYYLKMENIMLEDKLRSMFKQIQPLFLKYAPGIRKNFLSYSLVEKVLPNNEWGGNNKEIIMMTPNTFKELCVLANTSQTANNIKASLLKSKS